MEKEKNKQNVNIFYIIGIFVGYWPILLISVLFFTFLGYGLYRLSSRTYIAAARIALLSDNVRTSSRYLNVSELMNLEKTFTNEVSFIRSTPLIREVLEDMNYYVSYFIKEDKIPRQLAFAFHNIYNQSPFTVILNENRVQPIDFLFYIKILNDNTFVIHTDGTHAFTYNFADGSYSNNMVPVSAGGTHEFGENVTGVNYSFRILLNSNYDAAAYRGKDFYFQINSPQWLAYGIQESLSVRSAHYQSSIVDMTLEAGNAQFSLDFLNKLIEKYKEKNLEKKNHNANHTLEYIDQQLATISGSLGFSEQQLQNFRSAGDLMSIDEKSRTLYSQLHTLEQTKDELQSRYQNLNRLNEHFTDNNVSTTFIASSLTGISDVTLASLISELTSLSTERQNLINTGQLLNPRIQTLDANIATIRKVITDNIRFNLSSTWNEMEEVNSRIQAASAELTQLPKAQRQLTGLEREFNINDAVYSSLLDMRIQAQIIKAGNLSDAEIIEPPYYVGPGSPSIKKIMAISLFLGLLFPSAYIILVNFMSGKIRTKEELDFYSKLPGIGGLPHYTNPQPNLVNTFPLSPITEKFHSIRSNLVYYLLGEKNRIVLLTSSVSSEGKSFTSLNLATSFASTHNRTLLLNFDLRKDSEIYKDLVKDDMPGLSNYLIKRAELDEITSKNILPNLDFIDNGKTPPDPVALLSLPRVSQLFEELKQKYDYIIVDTPPFGIVTDAFLLMQYSDINLYMVRMGITSKKAFTFCMDDIESRNIDKIFLIENDVNKIDKSYYNEKYTYANPKVTRFSSFLRIKKKTPSA